jgi:hypothetical protein
MARVATISCELIATFAPTATLVGTSTANVPMPATNDGNTIDETNEVTDLNFIAPRLPSRE